MINLLQILLHFTLPFIVTFTGPMNMQHVRSETKQREHLTSKDVFQRGCSKEVSADTGQPVMIPVRGVIKWGLSTKPARDGEPIPVLLWLYNSTDQPQYVETCGDIDVFWFYGIDVFDSSGQRVINRQGEKKKGQTTMFVCSRNFYIEIPAHTCKHAGFSKPEFDFIRDLRRFYDLIPGQYTIVSSGRTEDVERWMTSQPDPKSGLLVTILDR